MTQYELAVLYHPDLEIDLDKAEAKVSGLIEKAGGKITSTDNWGKQKTAYPVEGQAYAVYVIYEFELDGEHIAELNNQLNITDEVIRFLITKPDLKARAKAEAMREARDKRLAKVSAENADSDESEEEL